MARPKQFDDEALLESMRETFLELGPGASTQELARRARVSEGTLFKRFVSKRRMFTESLRLPELDDCEWYTQIAARAGKGSVEEHLAQIALGMHRYASEIIPCTQMIAANGKLRPQDFAKLLGIEDEAPPFVMINTIAAFFDKEVALGRMRRCDTHAVARLFIGSLIQDVHLRVHFPDAAHADEVSFAFRIARTVADLVVIRDETSRVPEETSSRGANA